MKNILKSFFIIVLLLGIFSFTHRTLAIYERSTIEVAKDCPDPQDDRLISICGTVTQAMPIRKTLSDGSVAERVAQQPVEGISIYLYECDNSSPTCKIDGKLVYPFSSTSTNKYGKFHLIARKMDNSYPLQYGNPDLGQYVDITVQSKKRYLVFSCGTKFQGMQIIPSYMNLYDVLHEVSCGGNYYQYRTPVNVYDFATNKHMANQMGIDNISPSGDPYEIEYPEGYQKAAQVYFEEHNPKTTQSIYVRLDGGDPRFTKPDHEEGKEELIKRVLKDWLQPLDRVVPTKGAFWSLDCKIKYEEYKDKDWDWTQLCAAEKFGTYYDGKDLYSSWGSGTYRSRLFKNEEFVVQHLLPNISPSYSIIYYKPFELKHDFLYEQDSEQMARFLGLTYSNCVGDVHRRVFSTENNQEYPDCEIFKSCNLTLNPENFRNTHTNMGHGKGLASPSQYEQLMQEMDGNIPVCIIEGEELRPVKIEEIEPPGSTSCDGFRLCNEYWSYDFPMSTGKYGVTAYLGYNVSNVEDSFTAPQMQNNPTDNLLYDCDGTPFAYMAEAEDVTIAGCASATNTGGQKDWNSSSWTAYNITDPGNSVEALTDSLSSPNKSVDEIISGPMILKIGPEVETWGLYSKVTSEPEMLITRPEHDEKPFDNFFFSNAGSRAIANKNHYEEKDFENINVAGGIESGPRTPTTAIYYTSPSWTRLNFLAVAGKTLITQAKTQELDTMDSIMTVASGEGTIDWILGKSIMGGIGPSLLDKVVTFLTGGSNKTKTFTDRVNQGIEGNNPDLIDSLMARDFRVNEENFTGLFPLPTWNQLLAAGVDTKTLWGPGHGCYPWHKVGAPPAEEICNTYAKEYAYSGNTTYTASDGVDRGISRTCRVDYCYSSETKLDVECTCTRYADPIDPSLPYFYVKECDDSDADRTFERNAGVLCGDSLVEKETKIFCVVEQRHCNTEDCVFNELHEQVIDNGIDNIQNSLNCNENTFIGVDDSVTTVPLSGDGKVLTPTCEVSSAGPNECDGYVDRNANIKVNQQITDMDTEQDKINIDSIPVAEIELIKTFRAPFFSNNMSYYAGGFTSVYSSVRGTGAGREVSKRKDVVGMGGEGSEARGPMRPPFVFGTQELNEIFFHCENPELSDVIGGRSCPYNILPDPEVLEMEFLENQPSDGSCELNTSSECAALVLGASPETGIPYTFSHTFETIMNIASTRFNVPASVLLAYMHGIRTTQRYAYYWSEGRGEEELINMSLPWYGTFKYCDDLEPPAQHPYDWILNHFTAIMQAHGASDALDELAYGRRWTASRCNFLDATYVAASALGYTASATPLVPSCSNYTWNLAVAQLKQLTWGNPVDGVYSEWNPEGMAQEIFYKCRK